jgi:hypothetical protein
MPLQKRYRHDVVEGVVRKYHPKRLSKICGNRHRTQLNISAEGPVDSADLHLAEHWPSPWKTREVLSRREAAPSSSREERAQRVVRETLNDPELWLVR